ncbi:MAG: hypothetical protein ABFS23_07290, partial [Pseudomonadota bacterium]
QPGRRADTVIPSAHTGGSALAISQDSKTLVSGGWSGFVRLWDLKSGRGLGKWQAHSDSVNGIYFLDDERFLTAGYDGLIAIWNRDGDRIDNRKTGKITAATVDLEQDLLLTGHKDGTVTRWQLSKLEELARYQAHNGLVRSVAINNRGDQFASSGTDTRVALIDPVAGRIQHLPGPPSDPRSLAFSPDDSYLIGGGWFKLFRWQLDNGNLAVLDTAHRGIINHIQFTPDGTLASISRQTDSAVLLLDPADGSTRDRLQQHDLCGVAVEVSPDGRFLATTSDDASVRIWSFDDLNR